MFHELTHALLHTSDNIANAMLTEYKSDSLNRETVYGRNDCCRWGSILNAFYESIPEAQRDAPADCLTEIVKLLDEDPQSIEQDFCDRGSLFSGREDARNMQNEEFQDSSKGDKFMRILSDNVTCNMHAIIKDNKVLVSYNLVNSLDSYIEVPSAALLQSISHRTFTISGPKPYICFKRSYENEKLVRIDAGESEHTEVSLFYACNFDLTTCIPGDYEINLKLFVGIKVGNKLQNAQLDSIETKEYSFTLLSCGTLIECPGGHNNLFEESASL